MRACLLAVAVQLLSTHRWRAADAAGRALRPGSEGLLVQRVTKARTASPLTHNTLPSGRVGREARVPHGITDSRWSPAAANSNRGGILPYTARRHPPPAAFAVRS